MGQILSDVCKVIVDCEHKTAPTQDTGYPSIRTPNIGRGRLILEGVRRVSENTYQAWTRRATPQGDDLILAREAPVGNVAIVPANLRVCLGQRTVLIRVDESIVNAQYLLYLLLGTEIQGVFHSYASGATVPHLNVKDIRNLRLPPLPPLPTQRKIAAILSAYDDLIENNLRRIAILEEMARLIYREWFVHFRFPGHEEVRMVDSALGSIPEGWEVKQLGQLAQETRRSVHPREIAPNTPYVGLEHLPRRSIALRTWGAAKDAGSTKLAFRKGDILFGKIRPYFHKVVVAPIDGICSTDTVVIQAHEEEHFPLVLSCVSSEAFVEYATQTSQGTKMPRADWKILVKYPLVVPHGVVLSQFNGLVNLLIRLIQNTIFRSRTLRRTRDLLLPRLISGKIDVSEMEVCQRDGDLSTDASRNG